MNDFVRAIKSGNVIAFPTETVYGLGADAWNFEAIQKVFETKGRPQDNPLIVHLSEVSQLESFARDIPDAAYQLAEHYWPGPLTLILKRKTEVLDIITAGLDTVALRIPNHNVALNLLKETGPLVAPSANSSGKPSPTKAEHVREDFGDSFPILDGGECQIGLESTVLDVTDVPLRIYRPGAISRKKLEKATGIPVQLDPGTHDHASPRSPGQKYSHYTPKARVRWLAPDEQPGDKPQCLYLIHSGASPAGDNVISFQTDYEKLARQLYDHFRQADHNGYTEVVIETFSENVSAQSDLFDALINRISRAIGE